MFSFRTSILFREHSDIIHVSVLGFMRIIVCFWYGILCTVARYVIDIAEELTYRFD
jgi:hypothetical protein